MRSRFSKDPSLIGKLSKKRLDLSFSLPKEDVEANASSILPVIHSNNSFGKRRQSAKGLKMEKKQSIINYFEEEGDKPLPQIRISFSKLYELKRAIRKNPEEEDLSSQNLHRWTQFNKKQGHLIGHLYSPRSWSVVDPGFIKHQNVNQPRKHLLSSGKKSKVKFSQIENGDFLSHLRQNKNIKVKMVDYNKQFNQSRDLSGHFKDQQTQVMRSSSRDLHESLKQQATQSRIIPIQPFNSEVLKEHEETNMEENKKIMQQKEKIPQVYLKDGGESGYLQLQSENSEEQPFDELSFLWQENYIEPKSTEFPKHNFFSEEEQEGSIITIVSMKTSISDLKILLIEQALKTKIIFEFPTTLLNTITQHITQREVHQYADRIFSLLRQDFKPQLISFTKYQNCILITTKILNQRKKSEANKLALLWYYNGRIYVGEWSDLNSSQGCLGWKEGLGLEFYPSNYIYYGNFKKNDREGFGIMKKSSREVYIGEWSANRRSGWGKVYNGLGQLVFDGDFEDGRFKEERLHKS